MSKQIGQMPPLDVLEESDGTFRPKRFNATLLLDSSSTSHACPALQQSSPDRNERSCNSPVCHLEEDVAVYHGQFFYGPKCEGDSNISSAPDDVSWIPCHLCLSDGIVLLDPPARRIECCNVVRVVVPVNVGEHVFQVHAKSANAFSSADSVEVITFRATSLAQLMKCCEELCLAAAPKNGCKLHLSH